MHSCSNGNVTSHVNAILIKLITISITLILINEYNSQNNNIIQTSSTSSSLFAVAELPIQYQPEHKFTYYNDCNALVQAGESCKIHISKLFPTQFSIGPMESADKKILAEKYYKSNDLDDWKSFYQVPAIYSFDKRFFIVDHHHWCHGVSSAEIPDSAKYIIVKIKANYGNEKESVFWNKMLKNGWYFHGDNKGLFPLDPRFLPTSFQSMLPDPFRDLCHQMKGYKAFRATVYYVEFIWGQFLRKYIAFPKIKHKSESMKAWCDVRPFSRNCVPPDFDENEWIKKSLPRALKIAHSPIAKHMPGYMTESEALEAQAEAQAAHHHT